MENNPLFSRFRHLSLLLCLVIPSLIPPPPTRAAITVTSIVSSDSDNIVNGPFTLTYTFSEAFGSNPGDELSGADLSLSTLRGSLHIGHPIRDESIATGNKWLVTFTPSSSADSAYFRIELGAGNVTGTSGPLASTINYPESVADDPATPEDESLRSLILYDSTAPKVTVTAESPQTGETFSVKFVFTEALAASGDGAFTVSDIDISGPGTTPPTMATIAAPVKDTTDAAGKTWNAVVTVPPHVQGDVVITLPAGVKTTMPVTHRGVEDVAGNLNAVRETAPENSASITVDRILPTVVSIARPAGETATPTRDFPVVFTFSEPVQPAFDASKIHITRVGERLPWEVAVEPRPSASTVVRATVTPAADFEGEVSISLAADATTDAVNYGNLASADADALSVTVDTRPPEVQTVALAPDAPEVYTVGTPIEFHVTFDEEDVRYEGTTKPYVTLYLGGRTEANARRAEWVRVIPPANSTRVLFAYTVRTEDIATEVSWEAAVRLPRGTRLTDGDNNTVEATAEMQELRPRGEDDTTAGPTPAQETQPLLINPFLPVETPVVELPPTEVPRAPLLFNEFGNGHGDTEDWLELRNVTDSAVSLKDWQLSVVQNGEKKDTSLIVFPDVTVPANALLLLTNSAPDNTPLAAGDDIADTGKNGGLTHLYLVNSGLALPDDGKFLLLLRNAKEKLGTNEAFVDVAGGGGSGTDAFIRSQTGAYDTYVWPLQVRQAPESDTEEALVAGRVWQRANAGVVGYHQDAWAAAAFTGLGYDRSVSKSAATAGTPGYPNSAVKTAAATGSVTISEVMFDSADNTLPQWIELYNHSKTEARNLNRWKLEIQNVDSAELVGRPIVTLTLGEKVIQPNQTLLIVAGDARASSTDVFPNERVYNLLALHQKNLRIKQPHDTFLSVQGFYLKLSDRDGTTVDEVGNTDGERRTKDAPAWALPMSPVEGSRSSLIRRYKNGVAMPGMKRESWALAATLKKLAVEALHYGHADDIGTPGYRAGGALPVELSNFSVTRTESDNVVLTWTTASEVDNAGFNLRRSEQRNSEFTLLNPVLITGAGTTGERQTYTFTDTTAKPGVEYYYQIEEVSFAGKPQTLATRLLRGSVSPANRMLTTFGEMKQQE